MMTIQQMTQHITERLHFKTIQEYEDFAMAFLDFVEGGRGGNHRRPQSSIGQPDAKQVRYDTTVKLNEGANLVGLELIDHLIIGAPESANGLGFVSMAELMAE